MFVNGAPLNESGMENHPLTPMTDHNLVRWLNFQTKSKVGLINIETIKNGSEAINEKIAYLKPCFFKKLILVSEISIPDIFLEDCENK